MDDVINYVTNPATNPQFFRQQGPKYDPNKGHDPSTEQALQELTQAVEELPIDINATKMDIIKRKSNELGR